jgi:signal transduction histidine kinase/CheY-like chemotaxis protein/purine-cytosine permease-like protein
MQSNQKILPTRRIYNKLVANEMMEDFALRFTARRARHWSLSRIAATALGIVSFLVLEAIGGAVTLNYGFENSAWAILAVMLVVFFTGLPISYYAAKYGVDIDLLSRGAGFGYIGSTIASLIYASFTFIFFALEAAIMSMALQISLGLPLSIGYIVSAIVVIPLVTHGISYISRFQVWTQPLWIILQCLPLYFVFTHKESQLQGWLSFTGEAGEQGSSFNLLLFGAASAVLLSLVAQIGEQVDFLRFLPEKPKKKAWRWWFALISAGPGWILFGALKLLLGSFLAYLALQQGIPAELADDPAHMYQLAFGYVFDNADLVLIFAGAFVVISQLKINVANAYAGSLAWSNFFSRVTHNHPGRVVWMVFNVAIALLLMELGIYQTIESMLSVYSVLVLAWLSSVVADLVINKPLGISPKHIEFKRSHLYDINPVGIGAMFISSFIGITGHYGWYGETIQALASYLAFFLPFILVPVIGKLTGGKYYLVDNKVAITQTSCVCCICENEFEQEDITFCPAYSGVICSLCCSLDVKCGDICRPEATLFAQSQIFFHRFLSIDLLKALTTPMSQFIALTFALSCVSASILYLVYLQVPSTSGANVLFADMLIKIFFLLSIIVGILSWLFVLARNANKIALKELRSQASALADEIGAHEVTSIALEKAKNAAEAANEAKSRYLAGLSHELRTPLNVMLGYSQLLGKDVSLSEKQRDTMGIMRRNGEHLANLIEGLLEISKIEAGRLTLHRDEFNIRAILKQLIDMFELQASNKGLNFHTNISTKLPDVVVGDKQRLRQILINLISNAIKYTEAGHVKFDVQYRNEVAIFVVVDTGSGISEAYKETIFQPFEQIRNTHTQAIGGTGLGLTISRSLTELMGGELSFKSLLGKGSTFTLRLMLPRITQNQTTPENHSQHVCAYSGTRKTILVIDNEPHQQQLLKDVLTPLGFIVLLAENEKKAFSQLESHHIDLITLDVKLSNASGWDLLSTLRMDNWLMPVLMVSANARELEQYTAHTKLHNGYISKPFNLDNLFNQIGQLLALNWEYSPDKTESITQIEKQQRTPVTSDHYRELITLAEIGYLSGFNSKLTEIETHHYFSPDVESNIKQHISQCNFPEIIRYLGECIHE